MAKGAHEIRTMLKQDVATFAGYQEVQKRLEDFYISRIGIRMVQFIQLYGFLNFNHTLRIPLS